VTTDGPGDLPELARDGERVSVRTVRADDAVAVRAAIVRSTERMRPWNPVNPEDIPRIIRSQSRDQRSFLVLPHDPDPAQPVAGRINLNGVVRGRFRSVAMGYDAYDPYAGTGLFAEGLRLVVDLVFASEEDGGLDLHRLEANVQPGNTRSAGLLRSLGFRHEGATQRMLYLADQSGVEAWRDHERFAVTAEEWPAAPYAGQVRPRFLAVLSFDGSAHQHAFGRDVARELALPYLDGDRLPADALAGLVEDSPVGAVLGASAERAPAVAVLGGRQAVVVRPVPPAAGELVPGAPAWRREVTRLALELRAAARTGR
jgi:ribosomal-protein-alanine N-acetyltransferase